MAGLAFKPMTLDEFLHWDDGTETRYELIGGFPVAVAMAPPAEVHGVLAVRVAARIEAGLASRRPCRAVGEAGIVRPDRADTYYVADIAVPCVPHAANRQAVEDPILIVEILSPGTERHDRRTKLPVYRQIDSVAEILLVGSDGRYAELHRRDGAHWVVEIFRNAGETIGLASVATEISMDALYDGIEFDDEPAD